MSVDKQLLEKCRFMTPEFRVAFPNVFKPNGMPGTKPETHKYNITMLLTKNTDMTVFKQAMLNAMVVKFGPDQKKWPTVSKPIKDGDRPNKKGKVEETFKGNFVVTAKAGLDRKPGIVDEQNQPILEPGKFYPGCYAHAQLFARVWEFPPNSGTYGIGFHINAVQKTKDGKPFSSVQDATQVFAPLDTVENGSFDDGPEPSFDSGDDIPF